MFSLSDLGWPVWYHSKVLFRTFTIAEFDHVLTEVWDIIGSALYFVVVDIGTLWFFIRDGVFYVGSTSGVWRLVFLSVPTQVKQLIDNKEFELALLLSVSQQDERCKTQKIIFHDGA